MELGHINIETRRGLMGSPALDRFKYLHKQRLAREFYAADTDLVWIEKKPVPHIVAIIDYKLSPFDGHPTFAECIMFNQLIEQDIPVYIVVSDETIERFDIYKYLGADWRPEPPEVQMEKIAEEIDWGGFQKFQWWVRFWSKYRKEKKVTKMWSKETFTYKGVRF
jgi:hypothetical protein